MSKSREVVKYFAFKDHIVNIIFSSKYRINKMEHVKKRTMWMMGRSTSYKEYLEELKMLRLEKMSG